MERESILAALEALIFACGEPVSFNELKKVFTRFWKDESAERREQLLDELKPAFNEFKERWAGEEAPSRGFALVKVADGWVFRSHPDYSGLVSALREERPVRLSKAALETLSIVAYRQPVTKAEVDYVRGVDCGGTLRILLERRLLKIVGKKEEPGRPLLYGTTRDFLSFFNLSSLKDLPSLREYQELSEDSTEKLHQFDSEFGTAIETAKEKLERGEEPAVGSLEDALTNLDSTEEGAKEALAGRGIVLGDEQEAEN